MNDLGQIYQLQRISKSFHSLNDQFPSVSLAVAVGVVEEVLSDRQNHDSLAKVSVWEVLSRERAYLEADADS